MGRRKKVIEIPIVEKEVIIPKEPKKKKDKIEKEVIISKETKKKIEVYQSTICEKCNTLVDYTIKYGKITEVIFDEEISYNAFICTCDKCGTTLEPLNIYDFNSKISDKEYRKKTGILQQNEIIDIILSNKRAFSDIEFTSGLDKKSIIRYMSGCCPLKRESENIKKIFSNSIRFTSSTTNSIKSSEEK